MFLVPWLLRSLAWVDDKCRPIRQCRTNSTFCILYNMFVCTRGKSTDEEKASYTHIVCILFSSYLCTVQPTFYHYTSMYQTFEETKLKFSWKIQFDF